MNKPGPVLWFIWQTDKLLLFMETKRPCPLSRGTSGVCDAPKRMRQSNMELLRLFSMFFVLVLHANGLALGDMDRDFVVTTPLPAFTRMFFQQAAIIAVNVFVLISGWFGIRPTLKGAGNFFFQVMFYAIIILGVVFAVVPETVSLVPALKLLWFGAELWFVPSYALLYILAAPLNAFVEQAKKEEFRWFVIVFFVAQFCYDFVGKPYFFTGYSPWSFVGLYMLARYLRLHSGRWTHYRARTYFIGYVLMVTIGALAGFVTTWWGCCGTFGLTLRYNSPWVILQAVLLVLGFSRLKFHNKTVNVLAASCFAIYLVHCNPFVFPYYLEFCRWVYDSVSGAVYLLAILFALSVIGLFCILADRLRIAAWQTFWNWAGRLSVPGLMRKK